MPNLWNSVVFFVPFAALAASLAALIVSIFLQSRMKKLFGVFKAHDIETLIGKHSGIIESLLKFEQESKQYFHTLDRRTVEKIRTVRTKRYNSFVGDNMGGSQSSSSAFLDESGSGIVLTSIYTRERTNVFVKPVKNWHSEYDLSEEEVEVINSAKNG
jgi:hypothetical protein